MSEMKKKIAYSMILLYVYIRCTTAIIWKCPLLLLLLFLFFILPLFLCHDDDNHVFFLLLHNHNSAFALFIVAYRSKKKPIVVWPQNFEWTANNKRHVHSTRRLHECHIVFCCAQAKEGKIAETEWSSSQQMRINEEKLQPLAKECKTYTCIFHYYCSKI